MRRMQLMVASLVFLAASLYATAQDYSQLGSSATGPSMTQPLSAVSFQSVGDVSPSPQVERPVNRVVTLDRNRERAIPLETDRSGGQKPSSAAGANVKPGRLALRTSSPNSRQDAPARNWFNLQGGTPITTTLWGLSTVLGLFLLLAWAFRKRLPNGTARLPDEIIEVLGRTTLAAKQSLHLVRVGGKLIVVSITATGTETLTEINDADEVGRILAACQRESAHSSTSAFRQVFEQMGREASPGFLGDRQPNGGIPPSGRRAA